MNVLFFHRENDFTGSTRALATVIETEFPGEDVVVVTIDNKNGGFLTNMPQVKLKKIYFPSFYGKKIKFFSHIVSLLHLFLISLTFGFKFEIFYVNTIVPYPAVIGGRLIRKKIIYHIHEKFIDNSIGQKIIEFVFNHVKSERIFVSKYVFNQYPSSYNNYVIKYNKLPLSFLNEISITPIQNRPLKNIIMISSLSESKGVRIFVELANKMPEFNFTLIVSTSQNKIDSFFCFKNNSNLKIIPSQQNLHPFLYQSDLLLNLSIPSLCIETFGLTILEAMAYGIPSIVPNIGGPVELIKNGYNGYCVDVENLNVLVDKIKFVLKIENYCLFANNAFKQLEKFV